MPDRLEVDYTRPRSAILPATSPLVQDTSAGDVTMDDVADS